MSCCNFCEILNFMSRENRPAPCNNVMAEIRKFSWPAELSGDISQPGNMIANCQCKGVLIMLVALIQALHGVAAK